jgi:DNA-binding beta-propeller fold protein YncE
VTDAGGKFLFVADFNSNEISVFNIGSSGALTRETGSPFFVVGGSSPGFLLLHPSGNFLYASNLRARSTPRLIALCCKDVLYCLIPGGAVIRRSILAISALAFSISFGVLLAMPAALEVQSAMNSLAPSTDRGWIDTSNQYTHMLLAVVFKHHPELASRQGVSDYDTKISQPSWADQDEER